MQRTPRASHSVGAGCGGGGGGVNMLLWFGGGGLVVVQRYAHIR